MKSQSRPFPQEFGVDATSKFTRSVWDFLMMARNRSPVPTGTVRDDDLVAVHVSRDRLRHGFNSRQIRRSIAEEAPTAIKLRATSHRLRGVGRERKPSFRTPLHELREPCS
jgi:hypothetical protein